MVCDVCGETVFGTVTLVSRTGTRKCFAVDTRLGRRLLAALDAADAVVASDPQFQLARDRAAGGWIIAHAAGARNPTFLDGVAIVDTPRLEHGQTISIGVERLPLRVEIDE